MGIKVTVFITKVTGFIIKVTGLITKVTGNPLLRLHKIVTKVTG